MISKDMIYQYYNIFCLVWYLYQNIILICKYKVKNRRIIIKLNKNRRKWINYQLLIKDFNFTLIIDSTNK